MKIERHSFGVSRLKAGYANACKDVADWVPSARERSSSLTLLIDACFHLVYCGSVVDPEAPAIANALRIGAQACAALMAVGMRKVPR